MDESVDWPKTLEGGSKKYEMGHLSGQAQMPWAGVVIQLLNCV